MPSSGSRGVPFFRQNTRVNGAVAARVAERATMLETDPDVIGAYLEDAAHFPGGHAEGFADTFQQLYLSIHGWIASGLPGDPPFPTFADGDREVRLCEAIARGATEGTWIGVAS